jgi:hypothetical protein
MGDAQKEIAQREFSLRDFVSSLPASRFPLPACRYLTNSSISAALHFASWPG